MKSNRSLGLEETDEEDSLVKKALVIGIDDYQFFPLNGCVNDANLISKALEENEDGSPNFSVKLITSDNQEVSRSKMRESIEQLFSSEPDMALLYFAGHGFIKSTGGYLVSSDNKKYDEGVSMDEILSVINHSKAKNRVVILDCCHSGAMGTPNIADTGITQIAEGVSVLTASRDDEASKEINGHGVFTSLLIDALNGGAADIRGNITPGSLYSYVDEALGAWEQRPIFKTNIASFSTIRKVEPKVPLKTLRKITQYFPKVRSDYDLDPSYEDTEATADPAKVEIFKDLQKYQSVGLVAPVDAEFMYFAAIESKSCRLTVLGHQYWRLANEKKI